MTIRHYGRILQRGTGKPFRVWAKSLAGIGCNWVQVTDQVGNGGPFTHVLHPGGELRAIQINGPFLAGYDSRIEPRADMQTSDFLYCDQLDPLNGDIGLFDYDYRLRVVELQDLTQNGLIQPNNITAWVNNPTDTTLDGVTDNADLVDVIEAVAESDN